MASSSKIDSCTLLLLFRSAITEFTRAKHTQLLISSNTDIARDMNQGWSFEDFPLEERVSFEWFKNIFHRVVDANIMAVDRRHFHAYIIITGLFNRTDEFPWIFEQMNRYRNACPRYQGNGDDQGLGFGLEIRMTTPTKKTFGLFMTHLHASYEKNQDSFSSSLSDVFEFGKNQSLSNTTSLLGLGDQAYIEFTRQRQHIIDLFKNSTRTRRHILLESEVDGIIAAQMKSAQANRWVWSSMTTRHQ